MQELLTILINLLSVSVFLLIALSAIKPARKPASKTSPVATTPSQSASAPEPSFVPGSDFGEATAAQSALVESYMLSHEDHWIVLRTGYANEPSSQPAPLFTGRLLLLPASPTLLLLPASKPVALDQPNFAKLTAVQLRTECQQRGIVWRNAHSVGKHLRKQEMILALTAKTA